jgi:hypothetical protein
MLGLLQDAITPLWSATAGGCHPNRDTTATITDAGFIIGTIDRFPSDPPAARRARPTSLAAPTEPDRTRSPT